MAAIDGEVNKATLDARAAGTIHEDSQLNPADAGFIDNKGKERKPFDSKTGLPGDGLPQGMSLNPADVAAAEAAKGKKKNGSK